MPQIVKRDGAYLASRITGTKHNFLSLRFDVARPQAPLITKLAAKGDCDHGSIDEHALVEAVLSGVMNGQADSEQLLQVTEIQYVANDSPDYPTYAYLASLLVSAAHDDRSD